MSTRPTDRATAGRGVEPVFRYPGDGINGDFGVFSRGLYDARLDHVPVVVTGVINQGIRAKAQELLPHHHGLR